MSALPKPFSNPSSGALSPMQRISKYQILRKIGEGGMGAIYLCQVVEGPTSGRLVVLKCIRGNEPATERSLRLFRAEAQTMIGFSHPNIVTTYDVGEEGESQFLVLEWIEGGSLRTLLGMLRERQEVPPLDIMLWIANEATKGIHYAHQFFDQRTGRLTPIVHRDISPANLLVTKDGGVKLIDFGLSKRITESLSDESQGQRATGNIRYMSPEQCRGDKLDGRSDVFSLGVVLWEMLAGSQLFDGDNFTQIGLKIVGNQPIPPPSSTRKLSAEVDTLVLRALERSPERRYESAAHFGSAIEAQIRKLNFRVDATDVARWIASLMGERLSSERSELTYLLKIAEASYLEPVRPTRIISIRKSEQDSERVILDIPELPPKPQPPAEPKAPNLVSRGSRWLAKRALLLGVFSAIVLGVRHFSPPPRELLHRATELACPHLSLDLQNRLHCSLPASPFIQWQD